mgnify:CR=1 FL=1
MITTLTKEDLIAFEEDIASEFNAGHIKAPVHPCKGNESQLINIFKNIKSQDWVFSNWRSAYHCLLKGVPPEQVRRDIMAGKSITLCYPEYKIFSSAIVTGSIPIALGAAINAKRNNTGECVWIFCGDMTSETGMFFECLKYAEGWKLPIKFVIEDNSKSVCTDTKKTWSAEKNFWEDSSNERIIYYKYSNNLPHAGFGVRVEF